jgi:hypothetical protein
MKPLTRIVDFVLEQAASQSAARRIGLYRDLADIAGTTHEAKQLTALANELEAVEAHHQQLVLDFKRRSI